MKLCLDERISVIVNLQAGDGNLELAARAEKICAPVASQVYATSTLVGMKQRVMSSLEKEVEMFVIYGGDGTLAAAANEIANYAKERKRNDCEYKPPKIAYIPAGTGNLLKNMMHLENIDDPLSLLIKKFESTEIETHDYDLVRADYTAQENKTKSKFYTMMGAGIDAALLQDFEEICRGEYGFFRNGKMGYTHSIARRTIPREVLSIFERFKIEGEVRITGFGDVKQIVPRGSNKEILLNAHQELYCGRQADLHTVLAATTRDAGFGVVAFPHLDLQSQFRPTKPMQVRILNGDKGSVVAHLISNIPKILMGKYRNSEFFNDYLVGEDGGISVEYSHPCALQIGGDFVDEVSKVDYIRTGIMQLVDWRKLATSK